jgi:hypothetical protein
MRVRPPERTVAFPFDPDASTVNRTMLRGYSERLCIAQMDMTIAEINLHSRVRYFD